MIIEIFAIVCTTNVLLSLLSVALLIFSDNDILGIFKYLLCLLLIACFVLYCVLPLKFSSTRKEATKLPELTVIPISEVYQDTNQTDYVIKLEDGTIQKIVSPKVCIGDSNYVIKYDYVNMTENQAKDLHEAQVEYSLVVTSPDVIDTSLTQNLK